ncbi:MAG: lamin tail domain-containing protein, partial [Chloroflexota bacterium]
MRGASRQLRSMIVLALASLGMLIVASLPLFASPFLVPSNTIVISQIYGGGGNSGATYQNDFIELFNRGSTTINVTGWTVQYASAAGSSWTTTTLSGSIAPGQYYLIRQAAGTSCGGSPCGAVLPAPDAIGNIAMSASAGKVALVNNTTPFTTTCPLTSTNLIDFVGYGTSANCFEGAAPAPVSSNNANSTQRLMRGCTETDSTPSSDFSTGAVRPRNTAYPRFSCALTAENLLIAEVLYDGTQTDEGDEFIEIANPLTYTVTLTGYKIGDEETRGSGEGMYEFPDSTTITPSAVIVIARNAAQFRARFGFDPNFELVASGSGLTDTLSIPNLDKYSAWASGSLALSNSGDEVLLLGPGDQIVDSVAWGNGNFTAAGVRGDASASEPRSLQRYGTRDTNNLSLDFLRDTPSPGALRLPPAPPAPIPGAAMPGGMFAYWGDIHSHSTASDGDGPPRMAFDTARANGLHFFALTDHDAWLDTEEWNEIGNAASDATVNNAFIGLRGFEWTHSSKGHINVFNSTTWVSRDDPNYDTLAEFYAWLGGQPASVAAQFNHPDPSYGGTFDNFAYNRAAVDKIALVEVGNNGSVPYQRFEAQYPQALNKNWRVAPSNNSDHHGLVWGNDSAHRTGIIAPSLTTANVLDALRARRVFATEDKNLALALQANSAW